MGPPGGRTALVRLAHVPAWWVLPVAVALGLVLALRTAAVDDPYRRTVPGATASYYIPSSR